RHARAMETHAAAISLRGDPAPGLFDGVDPARLGQDRMPTTAASLALSRSNSVNWCVAACPSEGWASTIFGEPDLERLWDAVASCTRLDEPDPVAAWRAHVERLRARCAQLDERRFDALRFRGPGTDLLVGLLPVSRWLGGGATINGRLTLVNMPTEEVF